MTALPTRGEVWWCEVPESGRQADTHMREICAALAVTFDSAS
jgi:mRNA-degrading endonuclease toxin of MazEF toxin-antitoxin module